MIPPVYSASPARYESGMQYRRCGKSGILLPAVSLGLWHNFGSVDSYEKSVEIIQYAFDHGVCHFDLANNYGPAFGTAEETFGRVMSRSLAPYRHELFISTKAGHGMWPGPYGEWGSRKYLFNSLDESLRRMNLDYVDVFYSHRYDPETPLEETMQALVDIVRQGKALYVGISKYPADEARKAYDYLAKRDVKCLVYQGRYNMLDREVETSGLLSEAYEAGVGFTAFSPLAQGLLTDRYANGIPSDSRIGRGGYLKRSDLNDDVIKKAKDLNRVAQERGQSLAQMAISWLLKDNRVSSVIVGASSTEQLESNLQAVRNTVFSTEELQQIDEILAE